MPDYEPNRLVHASDLFSEWGEFSLARKNTGRLSRSATREKLLRVAEDAGWMPVEDLPGVGSPKDIKRYGITHTKEDMDILKKVGESEPIIYSCRVWISDSGDVILAAYRVDTN